MMAVLVVAMFGLTHALVRTAVVQGISMDPTLHDGEYLLLDTLSYRLHAPQRGDIIVFHPPVDSRDYVKRVIGVPGDTIAVRNGTVYRNGSALSEPYVRLPHRYSFGAVRVPPGDLFVLGDNRDESYDSHLWRDGQGRPIPFLAANQVVGRAMVAVWPFNQWQVFTSPALGAGK
jgi:signal peptidase I